MYFKAKFSGKCNFVHICKIYYNQGVKARMLGRQNERNFCYDRLALTPIFGLCFMSVWLIKSNYYSLIYSSLTTIYICYKLYITSMHILQCNVIGNTDCSQCHCGHCKLCFFEFIFKLFKLLFMYMK